MTVLENHAALKLVTVTKVWSIAAFLTVRKKVVTVTNHVRVKARKNAVVVLWFWPPWPFLILTRENPHSFHAAGCQQFKKGNGFQFLDALSADRQQNGDVKTPSECGLPSLAVLTVSNSKMETVSFFECCTPF